MKNWCLFKRLTHYTELRKWEIHLAHKGVKKRKGKRICLPIQLWPPGDFFISQFSATRQAIKRSRHSNSLILIKENMRSTKQLLQWVITPNISNNLFTQAGTRYIETDKVYWFSSSRGKHCKKFKILFPNLKQVQYCKPQQSHMAASTSSEFTATPFGASFGASSVRSCEETSSIAELSCAIFSANFFRCFWKQLLKGQDKFQHKEVERTSLIDLYGRLLLEYELNHEFTWHLRKYLKTENNEINVKKTNTNMPSTA